MYYQCTIYVADFNTQGAILEMNERNKYASREDNFGEAIARGLIGLEDVGSVQAVDAKGDTMLFSTVGEMAVDEGSISCVSQGIDGAGAGSERSSG
ncbi:hypothetical protein CNMCM6936_008388 [Aspergillus lentulus]|uniref:Uncharacterized protein n=1 Tax=Aspergillus lentulus TaxID=293939 RepID=A0AAN5YKT4_ASPLE|nr:hypothetical protein CNMCM6069_002618 [Aspergillus lentulus]KAF4159124.1 hypothetical protein CNMCM6069_002645 [Aspergillus lentulus]KAF4165038.1 hypothetical protein CNMCM6936_008388 [Aspergillus lentulus]KAF4174631.1 hypothetical protein CNMCM8060_008441 [Aspergillus lentulus]KAF4183248.1 hypothetical protein CNMCM7927_009280 [Aspergillus lentulus]